MLFNLKTRYTIADKTAAVKYEQATNEKLSFPPTLYEYIFVVDATSPFAINEIAIIIHHFFEILLSASTLVLIKRAAMVRIMPAIRSAERGYL